MCWSLRLWGLAVALSVLVCAVVPLLGAEQPQLQGEPAAAPEQSEAREEEAPEIEVEVVGKREGLLSISPAPGEQVVAVTPQDISDAAATTVMEAIDLTPSVFVRHQGARYENRLSIRGMAPRLVLLDGIPIAREGYSGPGGGAGGAEASFAGRILYTMPAEVIERLDVIRSSNTIVYGSSAAAGAVINIVTKDPKPGAQVFGTAEYGSYGRRRSLVDAGASDGHLGYYVLGGNDYAGSHLPLGEKRFRNAFGKVFYNYPDGSRLLVDVFSLDGRRTLDLSQDFSIVPARYWRIDPWKEHFANAVYSKAISEEATLDFVLYARDRDFTTDQYTNDRFTTTKTNWRESQDDKGVDLRYSLRGEDGRMTRLGLQWSDLSSRTIQTNYYGPSGPLPMPRVSDVSQDRQTWSLFANEILPLRAGLRLNVGARYDDIDAFSPDVTYAAGLEASVSPRTTWYLNAGIGVEHPEPTAADVQRSFVPAEASSLSLETGWTLRPDSQSTWTAALFCIKTDDARVLYNDPPGAIGPLAWVSKSEDLTTSGLEIVYNRRVSDSLSWFANYTYLREELGNENLPLIPGPDYPFAPEPPCHLLAAGVRADCSGTRVALSAKYAASHLEQNRLMQTAAPVDSYLVFDLKLARPVGSGELTLAVENVLDADYETMPAFPRPGRGYLASYRLPL